MNIIKEMQKKQTSKLTFNLTTKIETNARSKLMKQKK